MIPIAELERQHQEISEMMTVLSILINDERTRKAKVIERLLRDLGDRIVEHLALEDATLYKELLVNENHDVQRVARDFLSGSNQLKHAFMKYIKGACGPHAEDEECIAFARETEEVFGVLRERMKKEEKRFYPLAQEATR